MKIDNIIKFHEKYKDVLTTAEIDLLLSLDNVIVDKLLSLDKLDNIVFITDLLLNHFDNNYISVKGYVKLIELIANAKNTDYAEVMLRSIKTLISVEKENNIIKIVTLISKSKSYTISCYLDSIICCRWVQQKHLVLDLVKVIAESDNSENILQYATKAAISTIVLNSDYSKKIVSILAKAKSLTHVENAYSIATKCQVSESEKLIELMQLVAQAKSTNSSAYATHIMYCEKLFKRDDVIKLAKIIAMNCKEQNLDNVYKIMTNDNCIKHDKLVEICEITARSKEGSPNVYLAILVPEILNHENVINIVSMLAKCSMSLRKLHLSKVSACTFRENCLEKIIEAMTKCKRNLQVHNIVEIACQKSISNEDVLELVNLISNTKNAAYFDDLSGFFYNENIIKSGHLVEICKITLNAAALCACSFIKKITEYKKFLNSKYVISILESFASCEHWYNLKLMSNLLSSAEQSKISFDEADALIKMISLCPLINNSDAVFMLITTGEYKKSNDPINSIKNIITSKREYVSFSDAYNSEPLSAIAGLKEIENEFPGIDLDTNEYYIKKPKLKKKKSK